MHSGIQSTHADLFQISSFHASDHSTESPKRSDARRQSHHGTIVPRLVTRRTSVCVTAA